MAPKAASKAAPKAAPKAPKKGGNAPKKSWTKSKLREKLNNNIFFDKATKEKAEKEVPNMKVITPAVVADKMHITLSLAKTLLFELEQKGEIKKVMVNNHIRLYTRAKSAADVVVEDKKAQKGKKVAKK